ncbi:TPA: hypothetical protein ACKPZ3_002154 [Serratia marcescens]
MKKRFASEQLISILREIEARISAPELDRKHAISDAAFVSPNTPFSFTSSD